MESRIGLGVVAGLAIGAGLGFFIEELNLALAIAIGISMGAGLGGAWYVWHAEASGKESGGGWPLGWL